MNPPCKGQSPASPSYILCYQDSWQTHSLQRAPHQSRSRSHRVPASPVVLLHQVPVLVLEGQRLWAAMGTGGPS